MSTMSMHLKQQLEQLQEEYRVQQQSLQTEADSLLQQKLQLTECLVIASTKSSRYMSEKINQLLILF